MNYRQLFLGIACMVLISNLQYGWTLFVLPIEAAHHWGKPSIQFAFAIFIAVQAWSFPFLGVLVDRSGPHRVGMAGGALVACGWALNAIAASLLQLYIGEAAAGLGTGLVLAAVYGSALKSPSNRGLVIGLTSAGYGLGSAFTVAPLSWSIHTLGYGSAFLVFGLVQGALVVLLASGLKSVVPEIAHDREGSYRPLRALASPAFWVLYVMFMLIASGGVMATAQLAPLAHDYGVADKTVPFIGVSALVFALSLDRVANGISRPFFGWISDHLGREETMCLVFLLEAGAVFGLLHFAHDPVLFVILSGLVFFGWGEIFALFPALCTDLFGRTHGTTNYGLLYTAKGVAGFFVPWASVLVGKEAWGWSGVLYLVVAFDVSAALLAILVIPGLKWRMKRSYAL